MLGADASESAEADNRGAALANHELTGITYRSKAGLSRITLCGRGGRLSCAGAMKVVFK
ncbi:hypothetical protein GCM10010911_35330 [Paenibacillus nasutitermitis]|uniref:Uncharacterized protein n=1 Tax=Paenibacillus nasutitermitis TaxID=1652958 RepID=A0A916Z3R9_9BACL|nr:hypothetical protein GCM10010911_35330 [Paenibacillus nasutitermitis]